MGLHVYLGGLLIERIFASEIWGAYFREGLLLLLFFWGGEALIIGILRYVFIISNIMLSSTIFALSRCCSDHHLLAHFLSQLLHGFVKVVFSTSTLATWQTKWRGVTHHHAAFTDNPSTKINKLN